MKIDKSLQDVWQWREALHRETEGMSWRQKVQHIHEKAERIKKEYGLKLRKVVVREN